MSIPNPDKSDPIVFGPITVLRGLDLTQGFNEITAAATSPGFIGGTGAWGNIPLSQVNNDIQERYEKIINAEAKLKAFLAPKPAIPPEVTPTTPSVNLDERPLKL